MKLYLFISVFIFLVIISCSGGTKVESVKTPVLLKTSNKQLQSNFDRCLLLTEQLIKSQLSEEEFSEYFTLDKLATGFEFDNEIRNVLDTLSQLPKSYQIFYDFVYEGDTVTSFRADYDSKTKLIDYRKCDLLAIKKFIDKNLTVNRIEATKIALANGMKKENIEIIFECSDKEFYWECRNNCNECSFMKIDAKTGHVLEKGKVVNFN